MGRRRSNPKYLQYLRNRARAHMDFRKFTHGNPRGGVFITSDHRVITTRDVPAQPKKEQTFNLLQKEVFREMQSYHISEAAYIRVVNEYYPHGIKRFFSGPKNFFVEETSDYHRRSVVYSSKEYAMLQFNTDRITWLSPVPQVNALPK